MPTIISSLLKKNPCYKKGVKLKNVKGLMLHSVGCPQPNAEVFVRSWNNPQQTKACVHAFIDANSGDIYQTLPWTMRGWHCGKSGNDTHIGIEMCEPACVRYTAGSSFVCSDLETAKKQVRRTYESAVHLFSILCKQFNLNPLEDGCILSHAEGYKRKIATNHGDPEHLWKGLGLSYDMDMFREDVYDLLTAGGYDTVIDKIEPYCVRVDITDLNIRKGPGTTFAKNGVTGKGVFTIIEESPGKGASKWGKLKSGAGWISLDYAKRI